MSREIILCCKTQLFAKLSRMPVVYGQLVITDFMKKSAINNHAMEHSKYNYCDNTPLDNQQ